VFRFHGSYNKLEGSYTVSCAGGVTFINGRANEAVSSQFLECGNSGISVVNDASSGSPVDLDYTRVESNTVTYSALVGNFVADGISLVSAPHAGTSKQISVRSNTIVGFSVDDPLVNIPLRTNATVYGKHSIVKPTVGNGRYYVATTGGTSSGTEPTWPTTPGDTVTDGSTLVWTCVAYEGGQAGLRVMGTAAGQEITKSSIYDNNIGGGKKGISLSRVTASTVALNNLDSTDDHMLEANCATIVWLENQTRGAGTKTVQGRSATSVFTSTGVTGSATYDPGSLALGASTGIQTVTVTGAELGDAVDMSFSNSLAGAEIKGWVSAADTVSYYFTNTNGANPLDLASGTVRARVRKL
jgi:hypothetical protein